MSCNNLHSMYMNCDSLYLIYILLCIIVITYMFSSIIRNNTMQRYTVERLAKINSTGSTLKYSVWDVNSNAVTQI